MTFGIRQQSGEKLDDLGCDVLQPMERVAVIGRTC